MISKSGFGTNNIPRISVKEEKRKENELPKDNEEDEIDVGETCVWEGRDMGRDDIKRGGGEAQVWDHKIPLKRRKSDGEEMGWANGCKVDGNVMLQFILQFRDSPGQRFLVNISQVDILQSRDSTGQRFFGHIWKGIQ